MKKEKSCLTYVKKWGGGNKTLLLLSTLLLSTHINANFNFGECLGSGTFEQKIEYYGTANKHDFDNAVTVGTIPQGIQGLRVSLISTNDVDIRLYGENEDKIVHWPYGIHYQSTQKTKPYKDVNVTYSGFNGVNGNKGHEFIEVDGSTPTAMTMKAFGYQAGYAAINYSWTGKDNCTQNPNGTGNFTQTLQQNTTSLVGTIPPHVNNLEINLQSDNDLDIQLYGEDGTAIVSWKPTGLLAGATKQSIMYNDMNITWSGYNGVNGKLGHEYITVTPKTTEVLVMKVFGYEAGSAEVTYSWGEGNQETKDVFNVSPIRGASSQVSFTLSLKEQPDSNVTLTYASADETIANPTTNTLTFTPDNWYTSQIIVVDILDKNSSTEIVFEPSVSNDGEYNNKNIEDVSIVSHQIKVSEPIDKILFSEFEMALPFTIAYVGNYADDLNVTLNDAPNGMLLDKNNSRLLWTPTIEDEGTTHTITLQVYDGILSETLSFAIRIAKPKILQTEIHTQYNILVVTDTNSSLYGMNIVPMEAMNLLEYKLYTLDTNDTPSFNSEEEVVGDVLLVKGNRGKKVKLVLALKDLVAQDELLSFHTKNYFGQGNWRRIDYDYEFLRTIDDPVYGMDTDRFLGVMAFSKIKVISQQSAQISQEGIAFSKQLAIPLVNGIECTPETFYDTLVDYNNQTCRFTNKPNFKLKIYDYLESSLYPQSIEDIAGLVIEAQVSLDKLGMLYNDNNFSIIFTSSPYLDSNEAGKLNPSKFNYFHAFNRSGLFNKIIFLRPSQYIFLNKKVSTYNFMRMLFPHEYFHHSQYYNMGVYAFYTDRIWYVEATAVWFSNYVRENDFYIYQLLEERTNNKYPKILARGFVSSASKVSLNYQNGLFFEMMEGHCSNYTDIFKNFFRVYSNDNDGFINFYNTAGTLNCNFGTPFGEGTENTLETKLLYYQYATQIRKDASKINPKTHKQLEFEEPLTIKSDEWNNLQVDDYINITKREWLNQKFVDTEAMTIKFEAIPTELFTQCKSRYIRIKSDNNMYVSIATDDIRLSDTPNTMLGDIKQISVNNKGEWNFHYLNDKNTGQVIYPEMYITFIDIIDNIANNVEIGIGVYRMNLLEKIDDQNVCDKIPSVYKNSMVLAEGVVPNQYRDINDMAQYIDRIRVTTGGSGEVFEAVVDAEGRWSINVKFNGLIVDGYNSNTPSTIIKREIINGS